jgi:glycosyltransferase involved in cell wall biosynthesis
VELIRGCLLKGCECQLILSRDKIYYEEIRQILPEITVLSRFRLVAWFRVFRRIRTFRPDIVHSFISFSSLYVSLCKPFLNFRFVEESVRSAPFRKVFPWHKKAVDRINFFFADRIVSNSQAGLISYRVPPGKAHVIYNGFDFRRISSIRNEAGIRAELHITTPWVIGMVANFTENKDYRAFFTVADRILQQRHDVTFLAVGEGPGMAEFRSRYSGNPAVRITGARREVEELINIFTVGVLLSNTTYLEGISNSIMEYMALGKPVVATYGGGTSELVEEGKSGYLVRGNRVEEITGHLLYLLDHAEEGRQMGQCGRVRIEQRFGAGQMVDRHVALYTSMLERMKILFMINNLGRGGKERQLVELIKGCVARGHTCQLILNKYVVQFEEIYRFLPAIHVLNKNMAIAWFQVLKKIILFRPDIVHSFISFSSFYAALCKPFIKFRFVEESVRSAPHRDVFSWHKKAMDQFNFFFADQVVSNSRAGLVSYKVPAKKANVICNGFDFARISVLPGEAEIRARLAITTPWVAGMVANFTRNKDYGAFFRVADQVLKHREDVTFVAVGGGSGSAGFLSRYSANPHIRFTGAYREIEHLVNIFTVGFLLSDSRHHAEGISNSIMEYMALGKPVIATAGGGTPELVEDGVSGFLIPGNDIQEMVRCLNYLLDHPEEARQMGALGQARTRKEFSLNRMVESHLELYSRMLN